MAARILEPHRRQKRISTWSSDSFLLKESRNIIAKFQERGSRIFSSRGGIAIALSILGTNLTPIVMHWVSEREKS